jgi:cysteine desulfurase
VDLLAVDEQGRLDLDELRRCLRPGETRLVSVMAANNESGVAYPMREIASLCHEAGALYHCDAVQAVGKLPLHDAGHFVDLLSISAHKFHGPKGSGALLVRDGVALRAMVTGGGQERGRRSGTENPAGIVGLAAALELATQALPEAAPRMARLRDRLEQGLREQVRNLWVTAAEAPRTPNTLHLSMADVESDALLTLLDEAGIAVSAGSACSTGSLEASHVLIAHGLPAERMHGALRLSLSRDTTEEEIDRVLELMPPLIARLRSLGPGGVA